MFHRKLFSAPIAMRSIIFFILCLLAFIANAQPNRIPFLISTEGILLNTYIVKTNSDKGGPSINTRADTIPLLSARNVFALGGILYSNRQFENLIIVDFILTIVPPSGDTIQIHGKGSKFNEEMIRAIKSIEPNSKLFVEGIKYTTELEPDQYGMLVLMSFIINDMDVVK